MNGALLHTLFDALAWLGAGAIGFLQARSHVIPTVPQTRQLPYIAAMLFGAGLGAYFFGTANMLLSGHTELARSIEGAVAGGIVAVELYKRLAGITARTGARFALPFAVGVAIGRIGCYLAGLDDFTYGTLTTLPWAHDFGDGVPRHPVQLYESAAMAAFALVYLACLRGRVAYVINNGFMLAVAYYGLQRFVWEFIKPYGTILGPFTLFHLLSIALFAYAAVMIATAPDPGSTDERQRAAA